MRRSPARAADRSHRRRRDPRDDRDDHRGHLRQHHRAAPQATSPTPICTASCSTVRSACCWSPPNPVPARSGADRMRTWRAIGAAVVAVCLAPTTAHAAPSALDALVSAAAQRLQTADPVAAVKWITHGDIEDPARVQQVLSSVAATAHTRGIDADYVTLIFGDQVHATEAVESAAGSPEMETRSGRGADRVPDLSSSRSRIDTLNTTIVDELAAAVDLLHSPACTAAPARCARQCGRDVRTGRGLTRTALTFATTHTAASAGPSCLARPKFAMVRISPFQIRRLPGGHRTSRPPQTGPNPPEPEFRARRRSTVTRAHRRAGSAPAGVPSVSGDDERQRALARLDGAGSVPATKPDLDHVVDERHSQTEAPLRISSRSGTHSSHRRATVIRLMVTVANEARVGGSRLRRRQRQRQRRGRHPSVGRCGRRGHCRRGGSARRGFRSLTWKWPARPAVRAHRSVARCGGRLPPVLTFETVRGDECR